MYRIYLEEDGQSTELLATGDRSAAIQIALNIATIPYICVRLDDHTEAVPRQIIRIFPRLGAQVNQLRSEVISRTKTQGGLA